MVQLHVPLLACLGAMESHQINTTVLHRRSTIRTCNSVLPITDHGFSNPDFTNIRVKAHRNNTTEELAVSQTRWNTTHGKPGRF
jgi:hypothetical protein